MATEKIGTMETTNIMTHAEFAARLLREAASIFRSIGGGDPASDDRADQFATLYEQMADLVEKDPLGKIDHEAD
jgi:hypothetical protein